MGKAVCCTHIGNRQNYEDNFLFYGAYLGPEEQRRMSDRVLYTLEEASIPEVGLFVVSDGMGGHNAGEVASLCCVKRLAELEPRLCQCSSIENAMEVLQTDIDRINTVICQTSQENKKLKGMGATLILLMVYHQQYAILNIGDSRAYIFRQNELFQITKDHTMGQRMLDLGLLSKEEVFQFPNRKNLTRYMGYDSPGLVLTADEYRVDLNDCILLLCSDGLSDTLCEEEIAAILRKDCDLNWAGKELIERSIDPKHADADNVTAILLSFRRD